MKILFFLWLVALTGCSPQSQVEVRDPQQPAVSSTAKDYYRLASWNVRNLFDAVDDPYQDETPNAAEYQQKQHELAAVLDRVEADFIALQEVENLEALSKVNSLLRNPYPQVGLVEGNDQIRGIDVAFLSRLPVLEVRSHASLDLPKQPNDDHNHHFSRDCLEVRLDTEPPVIVLINHLKSARGDAKKAAQKRRAQAEGVLVVADGLPAEAAVFVVGDLNGRPDEWSLEPLFQKLRDPFAGLPPETRITHRYKRGGSALDHILLDPEAVEIATSARIWPDVAEHTSDHNPVSIELALKKIGEVPARVWNKAGQESRR